MYTAIFRSAEISTCYLHEFTLHSLNKDLSIYIYMYLYIYKTVCISQRQNHSKQIGNITQYTNEDIWCREDQLLRDETKFQSLQRAVMDLSHHDLR